MEDSAKLLAIEMDALADSVAADLLVDTGASQLDREQRFNMTGKTKSFAKVEPGCYVGRVFLYHSDEGSPTWSGTGTAASGGRRGRKPHGADVRRER